MRAVGQGRSGICQDVCRPWENEVLPIAKHREAILNSVHKNQVTIVVGQTGSGKTTEIPKFLYEAGFGQGGLIGVTEPRRIAALSVARFVASNLNVAIGKIVAHKIRFNDETDRETVVKFMTDGILLREFHDDPLLSKYRVIMIDEAHERSANIDFLLGLLKQVLAKRPELRLIVASATIDANKFSTYFGGAPVLNIDGRMHDVKIIWSESDVWSLEDRVARAVSAMDTIVNTSSHGDVLVFLTGIDEIEAVSDALGRLRGSHDLVVLPAHGSLSPEDQVKVFGVYPGKRKVVLATNIAETSITIDGLVYVIDGGLIKETHFDPSVGMQSLDAVEHSKAGCEQRSGRAGRTQPGVCYRLYTKTNYDRRPAFTEPEIKRMSLAGVVLAMEALEIPNIKDFDFIDPPDAQMFKEAYETLEVLGAIEKDKSGLTPIGVEMAALPLEPRVSRMVIEAKKHGCVEDVATIAAFMSVGRSVFARPKEKEREADRAHFQFKNPQSDMLTFLKVWRKYEASNFNRDWCFKNFLMSKTLQEVKNIRSQLLQKLSRSGVSIAQSSDDDAVLRCVAAGLAYNLLHHGGRHDYMGVERSLYGIYVHPGSSVFGHANPEWMVAAEVVETTKRYARMCSIVKTQWLPEIAPAKFTLGELVVRSYFAGNGEVIAVRQIMFKNRYGSIDPVGELREKISLDEAREIQERSIREAKKAGWILLTMDKLSGSFGFSEVVGRSVDGKTYRVGTMRFETHVGARYFCKVGESSMVRDYAYPQVQIFNFPPAEIKPSTGPHSDEDVLSNIKERPDDGSLGALLAAAAAKKKVGCSNQNL